MKSKRCGIVIPVFAVLVFIGSASALFKLTVKATRELPAPPTSGLANQPVLAEGYGKLPLAFEMNQGQSDQQVQFLARGDSYVLFLTQDSAIVVLRKSDSNRDGQIANAKTEFEQSQSRSTLLKGPVDLQSAVSPSQKSATDRGQRDEETVLRMEVVGADSGARADGQAELRGKSNYFIGNDPTKWRTNVPNYSEVKYHNVYPGVDLIYYGNQGQLEYDFVVQPGADPGKILLDVGAESIPGANSTRSESLRITENGNLLVSAGGGEVVFQKPTIYQPRTNDEPRGTDRQVIEGKYVLVGKHQVGFQVPAYDHTQPLVIDPTMVYSTYLGGNTWDKVNSIAVDGSGHAYVTGKTISSNFSTTPGVYRKTLNGRATDVFITELNSTGSGLVYSTYLGGSGDDEALGITLDASGNAYVTGWTASSDFPTTAGVVQKTFGGGYSDAFVTKMNATGSALVYSTYLGGSNYDEGHGIAIDALGNAYVTGLSYSSNFPIIAGAFQSTLHGLDDAFVSKLNPTGSALVYSTYLGGNSYDQGNGIAVDASGNAYVTGYSYSSFFPTTHGALQTKWRGGFDAFVSKLNASGSALIYSTYLGGGADDFGYGIALDSSGNAYVTGKSYSSNFPTTAGSFQATLSGAGGGFADAFVAKLNPAGAALVYSTYVGGTNADAALGIAVDSLGDAFVTGDTNSTNFPTTPDALQTKNGGLEDAFVAELNPAGSALLYSSYIGGSNTEGGCAIAVDTSGKAYVAGWSNSTNFPTSAGAFQTALPGNQAAFVLVLKTQ